MSKKEDLANLITVHFDHQYLLQVRDALNAVLEEVKEEACKEQLAELAGQKNPHKHETCCYPNCPADFHIKCGHPAAFPCDACKWDETYAAGAASMKAQLDAALADVARKDAALQALKVRIAFIGWPAEAFWEPDPGHKLPDWRKEINLLEAALTPATEPMVVVSKASLEALKNRYLGYFNLAPGSSIVDLDAALKAAEGGKR